MNVVGILNGLSAELHLVLRSVALIEKQDFGRTGHVSSRLIFGGFALGRVSQAEANRTLEILLEYGINHVDTAASYDDSELRIGAWMGQHRHDFFLATKTTERTYDQARDQIKRSMDRLRVDQIDLIQLHNLVNEAEWDVALRAGGALEAAIEARDQGLVRFIGVTGHGNRVANMHLRSLERFDFDSVMLPYNYPMMQIPQYARDFERLMKLCRECNVAVQTIKSIAKGLWGKKERIRHTWYEPLENQVDIDKAVQWVLSRPGVFLNTVGDINVLPRVLDAADRHESKLADEAMAAIVEEGNTEPLWGGQKGQVQNKG